MAAFEDWVQAFVSVEKKGVAPGTRQAERSAQTTANQDKKKVGWQPRPARDAGN